MWCYTRTTPVSCVGIIRCAGYVVERVTILTYAFIRTKSNNKGAQKKATVFLGIIISQLKVGMGRKHRNYRFWWCKYSNNSETITSEIVKKTDREDSIFIFEEKQTFYSYKSFWYEKLINDVHVQFKLDTGAETSILPQKNFSTLNTYT